MWTKLTDELQNSCGVVFDDLLQYVYWGSLNIRKLIGIQVKLPKDPDQKNKLISLHLVLTVCQLIT